MEMYERIKLLRKTHLKLSQKAFGEKLGVTRDVINNIENNRLSKPEQKSALIKLMCKEFSVNERWLLYGEGEISAEANQISLDYLIKEKNASALDIEIIKAYLDLDPFIRNYVLEHYKALLFPDKTSQNHSSISESSSSDFEKKYPLLDETKDSVG